MFSKKFWIPIVCCLIGVAIGGTFWRQHIASQEPIKIYKPQSIEPVDRSQPMQAETQPASTVEDGHFHSDGTWHAESHVSPIHASEADLASENAKDQPSEDPAEMSLYDRVVQTYIDNHYERCPDCEAHDAVKEDAKRKTEWYLEHLAYREKYESFLEEGIEYQMRSNTFSAGVFRHSKIALTT